jgi:hypothetical protein
LLSVDTPPNWCDEWRFPGVHSDFGWRFTKSSPRVMACSANLPPAYTHARNGIHTHTSYSLIHIPSTAHSPLFHPLTRPFAHFTQQHNHEARLIVTHVRLVRGSFEQRLNCTVDLRDEIDSVLQRRNVVVETGLCTNARGSSVASIIAVVRLPSSFSCQYAAQARLPARSTSHPERQRCCQAERSSESDPEPERYR